MYCIWTIRFKYCLLKTAGRKFVTWFWLLYFQYYKTVSSNDNLHWTFTLQIYLLIKLFISLSIGLNTSKNWTFDKFMKFSIISKWINPNNVKPILTLLLLNIIWTGRQTTTNHKFRVIAVLYKRGHKHSRQRSEVEEAVDPSETIPGPKLYSSRFYVYVRVNNASLHCLLFTSIIVYDLYVHCRQYPIVPNKKFKFICTIVKNI